MTDDWDDLADLSAPPEGWASSEDGPVPVEDDALRARLAEAARLPLNDFGNGRRFVLHFGEDVLFVPRVGWFTWSGTHWVKDPDEMAIRAKAQRLGPLIARERPFVPFGAELAQAVIEKIQALPPDKRGKEAVLKATTAGKLLARHANFAVTSGNSQRIENAAREAQVQVRVDFEALDADPLAVNTESGVLRFEVLDLSEDGAGRQAQVVLEPHGREQRLTKIIPAAWAPDAPRPLWDAFLERVQPDREMREFLKRWFGLSLTGLKMQRLVFLHGGGANGKSVLVDTLAQIAGSYGATARIESLTGSGRRGGGDATPDLIPLMGARMVRTSEPDEGQRLQEGLIKELTGGEPILMRALRADFIEVRPVFKLTMSGNHKPDIRGTDDGIWRRVLLVPFDVQIPEAERDPDLVRKLGEEREGILAWMVEGLMDFLEGGLAPPARVTEATQEYREESDPIGQFLVSCCVVTTDPGDTITAQDLGNAFAYHLIERGMSPWKPATFARRVAAMAGQWRHPATGAQFTKGKASVSQYVGLRLDDLFRHRFDLAPRDQHGRPLAVARGSED